MVKNIYFQPKHNEMNKYFRTILTTLFFFIILLPEGKTQVFYIGFDAAPVYSWYASSDAGIDISSKGWGNNIGFFLRYGKRPYYQVGFDWTRANNDFDVEVPSEGFIIEDKVPFHNFDFSIKVGYEIIQTPLFKWSVFGGPFIGRSLLFESNDFEFDKTDFINPQYGVIAGTGIQITNMIISFDYNIHLSGLFQPIDLDGYIIDFGGNLHIVSLKIGVQL